jgi:hypothetical protein
LRKFFGPELIRPLAEEAVFAIESDTPEIMKAQIAILARRTADEIDVSAALAASHNN